MEKFEICIGADCRWADFVVSNTPETAYLLVKDSVLIDDRNTKIIDLFLEHVETKENEYVYAEDDDFTKTLETQEMCVSLVVKLKYTVTVEAENRKQAEYIARQKFEEVSYPDDLEFVDWDFLD